MQCFWHSSLVLSPAELRSLSVPGLRSLTGPETCVQRGGSGPWEQQLYGAVCQLGQNLGRPRVAGKEGTVLGGPGRGLARGVLSSIQEEDKIQKGLYPRIASSEGIRAVAPQRSLVVSSRETACGSVAVLYLPVSVKPKNSTRGTLRTRSQTAGTAAAPMCVASRGATCGDSTPAHGGPQQRAL